MNSYALADGFLQGAQMGLGFARMKKMDERDEQRYQDGLSYRDQRDELEQNRHDEVVNYRDKQDAVAAERDQRDFDMRSGIANLQSRNLNQQYDSQQYAMSRAKGEDQRSSQLREVQGWVSLLENGDDGGEVAAAMNANPQYQNWLSGRGLNDAKFSALRLNNTGKGHPGVITIIQGKDRQTGKDRQGVTTRNASSDPDDPVDIMPIPVLAGMVRDKANALEDSGDHGNAEKLRVALLKRLDAYQISLGGAGHKTKWGDIEYREGVGYGQQDPQGQFHQLDPEKGAYAGRLGLGGRMTGASRARSSAFTDQIHKQMAKEFPDDKVTSLSPNIRSLAVSLAQDIDLESGGALAPGVYVQLAKEVSQGLSLSLEAAEQRAMKELNQGRVLGSFMGYSHDDTETQERAAAIMERDKAQFADRFASAAGDMIETRYGGAPAANTAPAQPATAQQLPKDVSLDDAAAMMVQRAKADGANVSLEQAKLYLTNKYPDRFGGVAQNKDTAEPSGFRKAIRQNLEGMNRDIVEPTRQGLRKIASNLNEGAKGENVRAQFYAATKSGSMPPPATLAEWLPYLGREDQNAALEYLATKFPDDPRTLEVLNQQGGTAAR